MYASKVSMASAKNHGAELVDKIIIFEVYLCTSISPWLPPFLIAFPNWSRP
jgi:hypothetical protein